LYWLTPVITFSVLTGLALDYDVFLVGRVREFRLMGYSDTASVVRGTYKTGGIITAAGAFFLFFFLTFQPQAQS
jgi:RND superfamily putative drug exporter